jgi:hypothetical protein
MWRQVFVFALCLHGAGCGGGVLSYSPPAQRPALTGEDPEPGIGRFVRMGDRNAARYLVSGFRDAPPGSPDRWADQHARVRFFLLSVDRLKFTMEFALPEVTFKVTGPVTLSFTINGHALDTVRFDRPGQLEYTRAVPAATLRANQENTVEIDADKVWVSKEDGTRLAFVLGTAGFTH